MSTTNQKLGNCTKDALNRRAFLRKVPQAAASLTALSGLNSLSTHSSGAQQGVSISGSPAPLENRRPEGRLLLFDDSLLSEKSSVQLVPVPLEKLGPVLAGDSPGDSAGASTFTSGTAILTDQGSYRLYYTGSARAESTKEESRGLCVADSTDGVTWRKPALGQVKINGQDSNRLFVQGIPADSSLAAPTVMRLQNSRYRMYFWLYTQNPRRVRYLAAESPDGLRWKAINFENPCLRHHHDIGTWVMLEAPEALKAWRESGGTDETLFRQLRSIRSNDGTTVYSLLGGGYEMFSVWLLPNLPGSGHHVAHDNLRNFLRVIHRRTSEDGLAWSEPDLLLIPDGQDAWDLQFYSLSQHRVGSMRIGFLGHYRVAEQTMDVEFAYSPDGRQWHRPLRGSWLPRGPAGSSDAKMIYMPHSLIDRGDHWLALYVGADVTHNRISKEGKYSVHGLKIPRFRFAGLSSIASLTARLRTTPFILSSPRLSMDAIVRGNLLAELCDAFGRPLPGFGFADSVSFTGDSNAHELRWKNASVSSHQYDAVSLRLEWNDGVIYGLEVSQSLKGLE